MSFCTHAETVPGPHGYQNPRMLKTLIENGNSGTMNTVCPPYQWVAYLRIQPNPARNFLVESEGCRTRKHEGLTVINSRKV